MKGQVDLFSGPPKKSHHAAGLSNVAIHAHRVRDAALACGKAGGTKAELAAATGLLEHQVSSALGELHGWGHVRRTAAVRGEQTVWLAIGSDKEA